MTIPMTQIPIRALRTATQSRLTVPAGLVAASVLLLAGCGKKPDASAAAPEQPTLITADNIGVADTMRIASGPSISGELTAERTAQVRAEVSGSVIQVYVEAGQRVAAGTPLARIDATTASAAELSARTGVTASEAQAAQAKKELDRSERLNAAGAIADRDLENARLSYSTAMAQLANVKSAYAQASKQLGNATVRAPFAGVVATKAVSAGDVVQPGGALFTVVDPKSMRLEAAVPAAQIGQIRTGMPVAFSVSGYGDRKFTGTVTRVSPVADPTTRQVSILASIPNSAGTLVGGLFAEGRVNAESRSALVLPATAIDQRGATPVVMRLRAGRVERVTVTLGIRDDQRENYEITDGLQRGDTVLLGAAQAIGEGKQVRISSVNDQVSKAAASKAPTGSR
ncbi:MAG: efflux RND transporter periplasmic adaptor subunit [Gemmatimonadaceae bacterium]|nr:efflux RND transporter periplasmic adaptor subunit [Gemmatimonadaceae bacterium]